jgi:hypothetical protein
MSARRRSAHEIKLRNRSPKPIYVSPLTERTRAAPNGLFGGGDGMRPRFEREAARRSIRRASTSSKSARLS